MQRILVISIALLMLVAPVSAQEDTCEQKGGVWDAEAERCRIHTGLQLEIEYPVLDYPFAQAAVDAFLEAQRAEIVGFYNEATLLPNYVGTFWSLYISYQETQFSPTIFSLKFTINTYTGGAHPNSYFKTFTFDTQHEREIQFLDLFAVEPFAVIAPRVQSELTASLGEMTDPQWLIDGTGTNPDNYQNFVLTDTELVLLFPPYQVATHAAGPQEVRLPLADLVDILAAPFSE